MGEADIRRAMVEKVPVDRLSCALDVDDPDGRVGRRLLHVDGIGSALAREPTLDIFRGHQHHRHCFLMERPNDRVWPRPHNREQVVIADVRHVLSCHGRRTVAVKHQRRKTAGRRCVRTSVTRLA